VVAPPFTDPKANEVFDEPRIRASLDNQWFVVVTSGSGVKELEPELEATLGRLEQRVGTARRHAIGETRSTFSRSQQPLSGSGVRSAFVFGEPASGEPRILVSQAESSVGTSGALPSAIERVFAKHNNQRKLRARAWNRFIRRG
jgi:hypothetical protein